MGTKGVWKPGDLVFAKMYGYPAWPARVEFRKGPLKSSRYQVYFFGTMQMGDCKSSNLHSYMSNKISMGKAKKHQGFMKAMEEIEEEWRMNENLDASTSDQSSWDAHPTQDNDLASGKGDYLSKKRKAERIDSKSLAGLLRPCFVRLNRVTVPTSGSVNLVNLQCHKVRCIAPDVSTNVATPGPSTSIVAPASSPQVALKSGAQVKKTRLTKPGVMVPNLPVLSAKSVPLPSTKTTGLSQLNSCSKPVAVLPELNPSTNPVFESLGLTVNPSRCTMPAMKLPDVRLASKLVTPKPHVLSRSKPKPPRQVISSSVPMNSSPISISEIAAVKPAFLTYSTNVVYEIEDADSPDDADPPEDSDLPEDVDPQYECIFCSIHFYNFDQLHAHTSNFHGRYSFCRKCKKYFKSSKLLMLHEAMCLSTQAKHIFHCNCCTKSFVSKEFLIEHLKNYHTLGPTSPNGKNFLTLLSMIKDELRTRTKNHVIVPCLIDCHTCKRPYTIDEYITTHLEQPVAITRCPCLFCGVDPSIYYLEPIKYLYHIKKHISNDFLTVQCEECGIKLISKYNGFTHMLHSHSNDVEKETSTLKTDTEDVRENTAETEHVSEPQDVVQTDEVTTTQENMFERRITSNFSDSSITSELEVAEYVLEVCEEKTPEEAINMQHVEDSCKLLEWMDISQQGTDKPKTHFVVHCTACNSDVPNTSFFKEHIQTCAKDALISCPLCSLDVLATDKAHFELHLKQLTDLIKCRICGSKFFNRYNQVLHLGNKHYNYND